MNKWTNEIYMYENFEDTKWVIRSRTTTKNNTTEVVQRRRTIQWQNEKG
jgi:hypothetical protein